jgi:hypothetical protein
LKNLSLALNFSRLSAGAGEGSAVGLMSPAQPLTKSIMFTARNQRREFEQLTGKSAKSRDCSNNGRKYRLF